LNRLSTVVIDGYFAATDQVEGGGSSHKCDQSQQMVGKSDVTLYRLKRLYKVNCVLFL